MPKTVIIAKSSDLAPGQGKSIEVEGKTVALFNVGGTFHAIDDSCTHRGGPLGKGELAGEVVTCPLHGATFNVTSGKNLTPPAPGEVRSYPVTLKGEDLLIELE